MTLRGNAFTGIHMAYIGGENRGQDGLWPEGFRHARWSISTACASTPTPPS